jgi:hypothetical protein
MFDPPDTTRDLRHELVSLATAIDTADTHIPRALRQNHRRHVRITMPRAKALVLCPNAGEEIAELLDVSRGGACFRSQKIYSLGSWIRIAAPCTVSASNVFVMARVVRARIAEFGREYGVEYVRIAR